MYRSRRRTNELQEGVDAYHDSAEDKPPPTREEIVLTRMEEAFETLKRVPSRIGPQAFGSNWPTVLREFADLADRGSYEQYAKESEASAFKMPLTSYEVSRMDEALRWPSRFLSDRPREADALNTWAMSVAFHRNLEALLKKRAKQARRLADFVAAQLNQQRDRRVKELAFDASQWANMRAALSPRTHEAIERIVVNAQIRLEREMKRNKLSKLIIVDPAAVSPDKTISRTSLDRHRYIAAQIIAEGLGMK